MTAIYFYFCPPCFLHWHCPSQTNIQANSCLTHPEKTVAPQTDSKRQSWLHNGHSYGLFCLQCPAIDYTRHTLDGAASLLNSNKYFPSRLVYVYSVEKSQIRITFPGYKLYVTDKPCLCRNFVPRKFETCRTKRILS